MEYVHLGRSGLKVSRLCLGTMNFGPQTTEEDSYAIMDKALELGINFVDTADVYGWKKGEGVTEQIVGRWLAQGGGRREQIVLGTKVYSAMGDGPNDSKLSAYHIKRNVEGSLRRLQTDCIDLLQMHHVDRQTPWEEVWQAMEQLVREGKVTYIGSSNFAAWDIATANQIASHRNFLGLISEQSRYSLADRTVELEVLPCCRAYGLGVIPWSPLGGGMLAGGALDKPKEGRRGSKHAAQRLEQFASQVTRYEALCKEIGQDPAIIALGWVLANPAVTSPIIGPRTMDQLTGALAALELELNEDLLAKLDEIWPGPGGEAPQAYAW